MLCPKLELLLLWGIFLSCFYHPGLLLCFVSSTGKTTLLFRYLSQKYSVCSFVSNLLIKKITPSIQKFKPLKWKKWLIFSPSYLEIRIRPLVRQNKQFEYVNLRSLKITTCFQFFITDRGSFCSDLEPFTDGRRAQR